MKNWLSGFYLIFLFQLPIFSAEAQTNSIIDSLNHSLLKMEDPREIAEIYYTLAEEWAEINFDSSYHYARAIQGLFDGDPDPLFQIYAYRAKGLAYDYAYKMDSATHYYQMALAVAQQKEDTANMATVVFNLGTVELLKGNYVNVLPWYNEAIELLEASSGDNGLLINIYINLGIVYRRMDRFDDAKNIYQRALNILDPLRDEQVKADLYTNMGNVMISLKQYDSAEYYYTHVKTFSERHNNLVDLAFANNGLGVVEESRGNYKKALQYFDLVINEKGIDEDYILFSAIRYKAELLSVLGKYDSATYYFDEAHKLFDETNYPDEIKDLYLQLADHYERMGQISLAMEYLKKHYTLKNQLYNDEVVDRTSEWEERYKTQEKENEIINLRLKNEEASLIAAQQRNERNIFLSLTLLLVVVVGFSFYMYQLKQKVNKSLEEKNEIVNKALADKELLMKEIHHRVKNNLQVISSLLNLQSNFITDEKANAAMLESKNRVHSMALIHQRLYQNENLTEIDLAEYLDQLIDNLDQSYASPDKDIHIDLEASSIMMDVDKVILLGLIVNELITNSFKYAFEDAKSGSIIVRLTEMDNKISLTVTDDGKGMKSPPEVKQGSLGTLLINDLSKKLKAELHYNLSKGTEVSIQFPYKRQLA
ncbi:MAG: tetratricopeptide repeat protein [Bacteroidota bacterium]